MALGGSGPPEIRSNSSPVVGRLTPSKRAVWAGALSQYLTDVMAAPSCPTQQRSRPMLCVCAGGGGSSSSRYHSNCFSAQALSDRERVLTHPMRGRPPPSRPLALIGRARRGRALCPGPTAGDEPQARRATKSRPRVWCPLADAQTSKLASGRGGHLEPWNGILPTPGSRGMRSGARLKNGCPSGNRFMSHGRGLPRRARVAPAGPEIGTLSGQSSEMGFNSMHNPFCRRKAATA